MTYPSSTDYVSALQDLRALVDPDLRRARLSVDPVLQIPIPASGNSAVVFRAVIGNKSHALRFFIREDASTRERYRGLRAFVVQHGLTDCTAATEWVDDAIVIRQQRWPMVNMEWVEGRSLDAYVEHLVGSGRAEALAALATAWRELILRMQTAGFAHGDLQHGNVLVDTRGTLQLVDFDGSWFVGVTGPVPTEHGHPNYQLRERPWDRWMDTFPGLLIYTALRSLAIRPSLWGEFSGRENILFAKDDFLRPFDTEIWSTLLALGDPEVTQCLSQLRAACAAARSLTIPLESMLKTEAPTRTTEPVAPSRTAQMIGLSPLRSDSPWWTQTGGAGPGVASGGVAGAAAGPATTTLPPPPPKSPFERPTGDGFSAGQTRPSWFVPPVAPPGVGPTGPGPVRGPASPPPRRPGPPPPGGPNRPPSPPPPQGRRRRTGLWVFLVLLFVVGLVVIFVVASSGGSSYGGGGSASRGGASSSYAPDPPSSSDPSTTELTDVELLLKHVPSAVSVSCTTFAPPTTTVVAALRCKPDVRFALRYYQYATNAEMDDAFDSTYRTYESGSCRAGEEGTETYDDDSGTGRYSCYRSNEGYNVMSWTHEETGILTLEISSGATFPELLQWARNAGPAS